MVGELLQVGLLLGELLLELQQLLLLAHPDGVVLVGLLALLEGVTVMGWQSESANRMKPRLLTSGKVGGNLVGHV